MKSFLKKLIREPLERVFKTLILPIVKSGRKVDIANFLIIAYSYNEKDLQRLFGHLTNCSEEIITILDITFKCIT